MTIMENDSISNNFIFYPSPQKDIKELFSFAKSLQDEYYTILDYNERDEIITVSDPWGNLDLFSIKTGKSLFNEEEFIPELEIISKAYSPINIVKPEGFSFSSSKKIKNFIDKVRKNIRVCSDTYPHNLVNFKIYVEGVEVVEEFIIEKPHIKVLPAVIDLYGKPIYHEKNSN